MSWPTIAPTRHDVDAKSIAVTHSSLSVSEQYWFAMMTCATLMVSRLYAVEKLEIIAMMVLRIALRGAGGGAPSGCGSSPRGSSFIPRGAAPVSSSQNLVLKPP